MLRLTKSSLSRKSLAFFVVIVIQDEVVKDAFVASARQPSLVTKALTSNSDKCSGNKITPRIKLIFNDHASCIGFSGCSET